MKLSRLFGLVALAGMACHAGAQVIITEVVDGPLTGGTPKWVEITNVGSIAVTFGATDSLRNYNNGGVAPTSTFALSGITLNPGQSYVACNSASMTQANWDAIYGAAAGPDVFTGSFAINGDDTIALFINDALADSFGIIGVDGSGLAWEYTDSYARRNSNICVPNANFTDSEWTFGGVDGLEVGGAAQYTINLQTLTSPRTHTANCTPTNDCNNNGIDDATEIAGNPALDCDTDGTLDSCEIAVSPALDCNTNAQLDSCEITANPSLDCDSNGSLDSCEILTGADCDGNGQVDACEIVTNPALDCNTNGELDACDLLSGALTDVNANGTADDCEGASVVETPVNGTVQAAGVRGGSFGDAFFNVEGVDTGTFASYGGLRWPVASITAEFDTTFGVGAWRVTQAYLYLQQSNAAFTFNGNVEVVHTNNDALDFTPGNITTLYGNYAADFVDADQVLSYAFTQGSINTNGSGTIEFYKLYDAAGLNSSGGQKVGDELNTASGDLTILMHEIDTFVAATYAGRTNFTWAGPTLVVFAEAASTCGSADFDGDGDTGTDADIEAFFACLGGNCCATCGSADFDGDGDTGTDADIEAFFRVLGGGNC